MSGPVTGFPVAKTFNKTMAMDLKKWSHDKKSGFFT